jgi:spoIIIJ-associated protein
MVRQKLDRRGRRSSADSGDRKTSATATTTPDDQRDHGTAAIASKADADRQGRKRSRGTRPRSTVNDLATSGDSQQGEVMDERQRTTAEPVAVEDVRVAAEVFAQGLVSAFGLQATTSSQVEGNEIEVRIDAAGDGLGLLIGPSGRTLLAIQDLARVAAQRRLGDHDTRLRVDVAGYREKRRTALERFAREVAELVKSSGVARSLEPMPSSDRKVVHDTLTTIDGVVSRSEGEDPYRRIIVSPVASDADVS